MKVSIKDRKIIKSWQEENCWVSQPVFVPEPEGKSEDQGLFVIVLLLKSNIQQIFQLRNNFRKFFLIFDDWQRKFNKNIIIIK